jgi:hypothetical protein
MAFRSDVRIADRLAIGGAVKFFTGSDRQFDGARIGAWQENL